MVPTCWSELSATIQFNSQRSSPMYCDATLQVDSGLFSRCADYVAAFRMSQRIIGGKLKAADLPLLIEAETIEATETNDD